MYTIAVNYSTGDSFNSYEVYDEQIGVCWKDKELAREALRIIKEHYDLYTEYSGYGGRSNEKIFEEVKKKDWYRPDDNDYWGSKQDMWYCQCKVKADNGEYVKIPTDIWCGYFEHLQEAKIVNLQNDEDRIAF